MRFPRCDMIPIMADTEIIDENIADDESEHMVSRRCKLHVEAPYLLKKVRALDFGFFLVGLLWNPLSKDCFSKA